MNVNLPDAPVLAPSDRDALIGTFIKVFPSVAIRTSRGGQGTGRGRQSAPSCRHPDDGVHPSETVRHPSTEERHQATQCSIEHDKSFTGHLKHGMHVQMCFLGFGRRRDLIGASHHPGVDPSCSPRAPPIPQAAPIRPPLMGVPAASSLIDLRALHALRAALHHRPTITRPLDLQALLALLHSAPPGAPIPNIPSRGEWVWVSISSTSVSSLRSM